MIVKPTGHIERMPELELDTRMSRRAYQSINQDTTVPFTSVPVRSWIPGLCVNILNPHDQNDVAQCPEDVVHLFRD